ncbi:Tetratricopeptide repeat-containing protein [Desulfovibrio sp. X2]|uniref:tetratricopeptide repeat protein n=1 Tax=Desulfovibrio sp. X2 TaxID=941449 RepID=UPI000358BD36|nr:tetratricopeptide repeat protein [Desulfovibrio sp. X2]EPR40251.1 Tetratricopeptide repeat-containing protein [Desulfovibrio sp. X2]
MADEKTTITTLKDDRIRGVFSAQKVYKVGTGVTQRKTVQQGYFYAEENDAGEIEIQPLGNNNVPTGTKETITKEDLLEQYAPEPEYYQQQVFPKIRELQKTLARADRHRQRGETFSAEMEYGNALKVDEDNVRATFGIGLCYMQRGDTAKAEDILHRLVKLDAAFGSEHKHLFNEFGINLRKNKMYSESVEYYTRAVELSPSDENILYNKARALFEQGDALGAKTALEQALTINPNFEEATKFINYLVAKKLV